MPTYDYKCKKCNYEFEKFERITAEPLKICPQCNGEVKRLIGNGIGIIFKGSGFYTTDYKMKETKNLPKTKKTANKETKKTEKKSETVSTKK